MISDYDKLRQKLPIDRDSLHEEAERQAELAAEAGELSADLRADAKRAKLRSEEAQASADAEIRAAPEKFNLAKVTESAVASAVLLHKEVRSARSEQVEAERLAERASSLAVAYQHRKSMIQVEVELWVTNYWGDPRIRDRKMGEVRRTIEDKRAADIAAERGRERRVDIRKDEEEGE